MPRIIGKPQLELNWRNGWLIGKVIKFGYVYTNKDTSVVILRTYDSEDVRKIREFLGDLGLKAITPPSRPTHELWVSSAWFARTCKEIMNSIHLNDRFPEEFKRGVIEGMCKDGRITTESPKQYELVTKMLGNWNVGYSILRRTNHLAIIKPKHGS